MKSIKNIYNAVAGKCLIGITAAAAVIGMASCTDIDENAPEEQLLEWYSYIEEASLFNLTTPNFHHWLHGCPRSSPEELQKLRDMRQEFEDKIKEINKHNSF